MRIDSIQPTPIKRVEQINKELKQDQGFGKEEKNFKDSFTKSMENKNKNSPELNQAVELINEAVQMANKKFEFKVHEGTNRTMVKVIDRETEEIIREIPPEEILDLVDKMNELVGLMMDRRV